MGSLKSLISIRSLSTLVNEWIIFHAPFAPMILPHLILVCGFAGSGKSYLSSALAHRCQGLSYVDKDTITRPLTGALLQALGLAPDDRHSHGYLLKVRPLEYQALHAHYVELLQLGKHVIAVAPFLAEVTSEQWLAETDAILRRIPARRSIVWVTCDLVTMQQRLIARGAVRDAYKLAHWEDYCKALTPLVPEGLPEQTLLFDNSMAAVARWEPQLQWLANQLNLTIE